jgi:hypothetical protein
MLIYNVDCGPFEGEFIFASLAPVIGGE